MQDLSAHHVGITVSDLPGSPPAPLPPRAAYLAAMRDARKKLDRDSILAAAMRRAGNVVLPVFFMDSERPGADTGAAAPARLSAGRGRCPGIWPGSGGAPYHTSKSFAVMGSENPSIVARSSRSAVSDQSSSW